MKWGGGITDSFRFLVWAIEWLVRLFPKIENIKGENIYLWSLSENMN